MKTTAMKSIVATLALLAVGNAARAEEFWEPRGWYGGLNLGLSRASIDEDRIANGLSDEGLMLSSFDKDTKDYGFKAFGGYQFNRYLGVEAGYFDLGQFDFAASTQPPGTLRGEAKFRGVNLDAVGRLPITDRFSAFARAGLNYAETRTRFSSTGAALVADPRSQEMAVNYKAGVGLEFAITKAWAARAEVERYRVKDGVGNRGDVDLATLGLVYRFGTAAVVASAPAPTREEIAQPPPAALPPVRKSLTLSADSQFDFDEALIKPAGKRALDRFATELQSYRYQTISVTGHTDRLGSEAYNLDLSTRRAEAVKTYLRNAGDIPDDRIEANGVGESMAMTRAGECPGDASAGATPELIVCLQADRRVEVKAVTSP